MLVEDSISKLRPLFNVASVAHSGQISSGRYWRFATRALRMALVAHAFFILLFLIVGATTLAAINVISVAMYACAMWLAQQQRYGMMIAVARVELIGHAAIAGRFLGWDSGFHYYVLVLVPLIAVNAQSGWLSKLLQLLGLIAIYVGMDLWQHANVPWTAVSADILAAMRYFNMSLTVLVLGALAMLYATEVRAAELRLLSLATTDSLTGLDNRRHLADIAQYELAKRDRNPQRISIVLCDIDYFKNINDLYGHAGGDQVLVSVAATLRACVRENDRVARWGGEEFLIFMPQTDMDTASAVAERIRTNISARPCLVGDCTVTVTLTLGVAEIRADEGFEEGVARADLAMYRGKLGGRNRMELALPA